MKEKIRTMITNVKTEFPTSEEDVRKNIETMILKTIHQRRQTKKKRMQNQCQDHPK